MSAQRSNAGAVALAALGKSHADVGRSCFVARSTAAHWRAGRAIPRREARAALLEAYGIDVDAWDQPRTVDAPAKKSRDAATSRAVKPRKLPPYPKPPKNASTLDSARYSLVCLQHDMAHRDLAFGDVMKVRAEESRVRREIAKIEQSIELSEDRYVRNHPAWIRLREKILAALGPHPDAAQAVLEAME